MSIGCFTVFMMTNGEQIFKHLVTSIYSICVIIFDIVIIVDGFRAINSIPYQNNIVFPHILIQSIISFVIVVILWIAPVVNTLTPNQTNNYTPV